MGGEGRRWGGLRALLRGVEEGGGGGLGRGGEVRLLFGCG